MRILAVAKPHDAYRWSRNLQSLHLEAHLVNNQVEYWEVEGESYRPISEDMVRNMFRPELPLIDQPFLVGENREFWIVLNRSRPRYREEWIKLKCSRSEKTISPI